MVASLFQHETISTTIEKAKEVKPFAEKLITLAKKGTLPARRRAISMLGNRDIVELENGEPVRKGTVIGKLFSELGPRYLDRPGGYTRIIRLSLRRLGDNGELVLLQLLGADESLKAQKKKRARKKTAQPAKVEEPVAAEEVVEAEEVAEQEEAIQAEETAENEEPQESVAVEEATQDTDTEEKAEATDTDEQDQKEK
jgi:large subunit ribosomal protein L17